jgi:2',3'-cyclic-nucleotide 2'-phosphodiesterase (5'-nucleotidase family)
MIRSRSNLGDFCADAYRIVSGADIGLVGGGAVRVTIPKGDIAFNDIISVHPFGNEATMIRCSGQQILDALEWGAKALPSEFGGFLQVSGLTYEIDVAVPSSCTSDETDLMNGIEGERRVKNVYVGDAPIDPEASYTVCGNNYTLLNHGDGHTAFDGAEVISECLMLDYQILVQYLQEDLQGEIGSQYADPYGEGRITIIDSKTP